MSDIYIGLYEEESDTACGVMALSVVPDEEDDRAGFFSGLGFFEEDRKLSLYQFVVSDVKIKKTMTGLGCLNPADLTDEQWKNFAMEASVYDFVIADREYYDPRTSVFLVDDDDNIQAGLLTSVRDKALFIEGVAAYGSDEGALTNDLIYWVSDAAKKCHSKDTLVYIHNFRQDEEQDPVRSNRGNAAKTGKPIRYDGCSGTDKRSNEC